MNTTLIAKALWQHLWEDYRTRVSYARIYEAMIAEAGGHIANDHIAFRTLRMTVNGPEGKVNLGIPYLSRLVEWLGYQLAEEYTFPDRHLYAHYYRHPQQDDCDLPKLFISELIVEELPTALVEQIQATVQGGRFSPFSTGPDVIQHQLSPQVRGEQPTPDLIKPLAALFRRPWFPPKRQVVEAVNTVSQYGAWVLLHGYAVNHFTGYINRQQTSLYPNIESTIQGLKRQGVPMKATVEGSRATGLQQIATQAVIEPVTVTDQEGQLDEISWRYAYYELAERHPIALPPKGSDPPQRALFDGFIATQAQQLFDMTHPSPVLHSSRC